MIIQEFFDELTPPEQAQLLEFFVSPFWTKLANHHMQMFGHKLISLNPDDPHFRSEYSINQQQLRTWQELHDFVAALIQERG